MKDVPQPARNTANSTDPANTTRPGEPSIPDRGKSSVRAGASTNAKMKESIPSSVQPSHAAQNPRTCARVNGSRSDRMRPTPLRYPLTLAQNQPLARHLEGVGEDEAASHARYRGLVAGGSPRARGRFRFPLHSRLLPARCTAR